MYEASGRIRRKSVVRRYSLCEVFVRRILPALRALLARELIGGHGLTQLEVSRLLGVSQPLINYYLTGRRKVPNVDTLAECPKVVSVVRTVARLISSEGLGGGRTSNIACVLCTALRNSGALTEALRACGVSEDEIEYPACGEGAHQ